MIPQDPVMLLSFINMKLRDNYENLDKLADDLELNSDDINAIIAKLNKLGYSYDEKRNQFC